MKLKLPLIITIAITVAFGFLLTGCENEESKLELARYQRNLSAKNNEIAKLKRKQTEFIETIETLEKQLVEQRETSASFGSDVVNYQSKTQDLKQELDETRIKLALIGKKYSSLQRMIIARGASLPNPGEETIVHYWRLDENYDGWGVHAWSPALLRPINWNTPVEFKRTDNFGNYAILDLNSKNAYGYELNFLIHKGSLKDTLENRKFNAGSHPEVWIVQGVPEVYLSLIEAEATKRRVKRNGVPETPDPANTPKKTIF